MCGDGHKNEPNTIQTREQILGFRRIIIVCALLTGCVSVPIGEPGDGILKGRVLVEWEREDEFIYRKTSNPLFFKPSFMTTPIIPDEIYTDGGSVPRILWNVPGLSPWALGPAYIMHDWVFQVHRCNRDAPDEVKAITFEQSAQILAEVGKSLVAAGLIDNNRLPAIVLAIRTRYARNIWDRPGTSEECRVPRPQVQAFGARQVSRRVIDFTIPEPE